MTTAQIDDRAVARVLAERRAAAEQAERAEIAAELARQAEAEAQRAANLRLIEDARTAAVAALAEAAPLIAEVEALVEALVGHTRRVAALHKIVGTGHERQAWGSRHLETKVTLPSQMPIGAALITRIVGVARALAKAGNVSVERAQTRAMQAEL